MNTAVYPTIEDWDAFVRALIPGPAAVGDSESVVQALAIPWSEMEQQLEALALGIVDLDVAPVWVIDVMGRRVNEPAGGLLPTEHRRLVNGRRLSIGSAGTAANVYAVLLGLAGTTEGRFDLLIGEDSGATAAAMSALAAFSPSTPWILRAGRVLRDALPLSAEAEATLATSTTARWGRDGWDEALTWGYDLDLE